MFVQYHLLQSFLGVPAGRVRLQDGILVWRASTEGTVAQISFAGNTEGTVAQIRGQYGGHSGAN